MRERGEINLGKNEPSWGRVLMTDYSELHHSCYLVMISNSSPVAIKYLPWQAKQGPGKLDLSYCVQPEAMSKSLEFRIYENGKDSPLEQPPAAIIFKNGKGKHFEAKISLQT